MILKRSLGLGLVLILHLIIPAGVVFAQAEVNFSEVQASHIFGEKLTFEADISTNEPITHLELVFKPAQRNSIMIPVSVIGGHHLSAVYQINQQDSFAPFTKISYWFIAHLESGEQVSSGSYAYTYSDNRYTWQSLEGGENYRAYWIEGDTAFGQSIIDAVESSYPRFEQYLTLPIPETLDIFVYPTASSLQSALETSGTSWVSGHADPARGQAFVSISDSYDNQFEIENVIPHEVTHIRLYLQLGDNYANLPAWLNEGISTLSERYQATDWSLVEEAQDEDELIPFIELCDMIPGGTNAARLAYAQSESLVRFIFDQYGKIGLQALVEAYHQGYPCGSGVQAGLGISLADLEADWYQENFQQVRILTSEGSEDLFGLAVIGAALFFTPMLTILIGFIQRVRREK